MEQASIHLLEDILEGQRISREYQVTQEIYQHFLQAFDDRSPIHVDLSYAQQRGFDHVVMHGAILNGFVSHFVGMYFPGRNSLLLSVDLRYSSPTYCGDRIRIEAVVAQKQEEYRVIAMKIRCMNLTHERLSASGHVQVLVSKPIP